MFQGRKMTGQTIEILVFSIQREIRLRVMVKTPQFPVVRRVTGLAGTAQSLGMVIVGGMAVITFF